VSRSSDALVEKIGESALPDNSPLTAAHSALKPYGWVPIVISGSMTLPTFSIHKLFLPLFFRRSSLLLPFIVSTQKPS